MTPGLIAVVGPNPQSGSQLDAMVSASMGHGAAWRSHHADDFANLGWGPETVSNLGESDTDSHDEVIAWVWGGGFVTEDHMVGSDAKAAQTDPRQRAATHVANIYRKRGLAFVEALNGSFCGLLIDTRQRKLIVFNDRYGAARMYVHRAGDVWSFSTRAKALLQLHASARRWNHRAVAESIAVGCVMNERSLFHSIDILPPASCWVFECGRLTGTETYFNARSWEEQESISDAQFAHALQQTFSALLPIHLNASVQPAMSLTGGIDGRMIMAMAKAAPGALPCYSFGGMVRDCHDVTLARHLATLCQQPHTTLRVDETMLAQFPSLAEQCIEFSDGTMDVSGAVEVYANRLARDISPVRITGNYGSEIVRGNVAFGPRRLDTSLFEPAVAAMILEAQAQYRAERSGSRSTLDFIAFKQIPWHHQARLSVERSILDVRSPYLDNRLVALMFRASPAMRQSLAPSLSAVHASNPAVASLPTDRGVAFHGRSSRFRRALREFSVRAEYAYDYGMPQALVNVDRWLAWAGPERLFLGRHKFYHFRIWYRRVLADYLRDTLLAPNAHARSWYRSGVLENLVEAHIRGRANHTLDLHRALTIELTHRRLLAGAPP